MVFRYFTLEEAECTLPKVKRHMTRLMSVHDELTALSGVKISADPYDWTTHLLAININKRYHELSFKYFAELESLTKIGCYVKDVQQGLVDFYSKMGQKDILLSWQYDEPNLLYYHDESSGVNRRIPISKLRQKLFEQQHALL
ncbi:MAG: DUF2203 family protein [Candidatus Diapherotrites archaeon]